MLTIARILIFGFVVAAAAAGQTCGDIARLDVRNSTIRTGPRTFAFHNGIAENDDVPPGERVGARPDWRADIVQDRILQPAPNVVARFLLIHDSHVTGSGWRFYATAFRCVNGRIQEVFHREGLSLHIDRLDSNRIDVSQMTTPGKPVRKRWSYVWNASASRYVLSTGRP